MVMTQHDSMTNHDSYNNHPTAARYEAYFPKSMRMDAESTPKEEWWRFNDLDVHLDRLDVESSPIKVIVLHGVGAYGRVMSPAAVIARRHGYSTVSPDLPGYGLTKVPNKQLNYELWLDCVCGLIDAELKRDGKPVVLFGVSLGGALAYQAAARSKKVIGVATTMLADLSEPTTRRELARNKALGAIGYPLMSGLSFAIDGMRLPMAQLSKMHLLSNLPELSEIACNDRMGGGSWMPVRFLRTMMSLPLPMEPEEFNVCPVLLAHPGEDRMTDIGVSQRFFDRLTCEKRFVILEGAGHMPIEEPGVSQLEAAVLEFLADRVRSVSSGFDTHQAQAMKST